MASLKPGVLKCFGEEPPGEVASSVRLGGEAQEKEKGGDVTMPKSECACLGFYWACEYLCKRELPFL